MMLIESSNKRKAESIRCNKVLVHSISDAKIPNNQHKINAKFRCFAETFTALLF